MSDSQNIEIVLHMVNKMCGELVDKGHEYFLVTANPSKALNIGSAKGRQFLHANRDVVHRFIKHCYGSEAKITEKGPGEKSVPVEVSQKKSTPKVVSVVKVKGKKAPSSSQTTPPSSHSLSESQETPPSSQRSTQSQETSLSSQRSTQSQETPPSSQRLTQSQESQRKGEKQKTMEKTKRVENPPVLTAVNLTATPPKMNKPIAKSKNSTATKTVVSKSQKEGETCQPRELKVELSDSPYVSSPTEDTDGPDSRDKVKSSPRMSLRAQRKRKIFTDCEMSPLKIVRQTFQSESKSSPVCKNTNKVTKDKGHSNKTSPTLDKVSKPLETQSLSDTKTSKSLLGSALKSKQGDNSVGLQKCSVKLSDISVTKMAKFKTASSVVSSNKPNPKEKSVLGEYTGIKDVESPGDEITDVCVKSEAGSQTNKMDLDLQCDDENDEDFLENDFVDDSSDDDFSIKKKVSVKKNTVKKKAHTSLKKSVKKGVKVIHGKSKGVKYKPTKLASFTCLVCEKVFRGAGAMARHMIVHTKQCMDCKEEFPNHETLLVHRKTCKHVKRSDKVYPCDKCELICIAPWSLRRHQIACHEWRCRYCKVLHDSEENLEKHLETCIDKAVKENEQRDRQDSQRQVCGTCGKQFANKGILMSHMRCHTDEVSALISDICGVDLELVDKIVDDVRHKPKENDNIAETDEIPSPSLLKCGVCTLEFSTPKDLTKHKKTCKVEKKKYMCHECDKSFKLRCELNKHARNYHPETYSARYFYRNERDFGERISCKYCDRTSYNQAWMKAHMESHIQKGDLLLDTKQEPKEENMETDSLAEGTEVNKVGSEVNIGPEGNNVGSGVSEVGSEVNKVGSEVNGETILEEATDTLFDHDAESEVNNESELNRSVVSNAGSEVNDSKVTGPLLSKDGNVLLSSLRCKLCNVSFKNKYELYSHAVSHRVFKCEICGRIMSSSGSLKKHLEIAHSDQRDYMCELCGKAFKTPRCVQQHITKVHGRKKSRKNGDSEGPFPCPVCNKMFDTKRLLTKHKYYHKDRTAACPVCEKCFSGKGEMLYHLKHVHSDARNYVCTLCNRSYKTNSSLREHRAQHHLSKESWRHRCEYCNKLFNKKSQLTYHLKTHTGDKPFACTHCDLTFTQKGNLHKHLQTVHIREVQYTCELCGKGFFLNENYKLHMRTHAVENGTAAMVGNKYGVISHCTICNRYFPRTCTYKAHLLMHKEEWKYLCPICKKKFVTVTSCTRHLKTHLKCHMTSLEIREKFSLKIGASENSEMSHMIKTEEGRNYSESESKSVFNKKASAKMKHTEAPKKIKLDLQKLNKVISPKKAANSGSVVRSVLESLATGGMVEESEDISYNLVPVMNDATAASTSSINTVSNVAKAVESIINIPSTSTDSFLDSPSVVVNIEEPSTSSVTVDSIVDNAGTSSAVQSILMENVNNVMQLDEKMLAADTMTTLGNPENTAANNTQEMSPNEINEILQTVNSEDFLQQLGSGNIILVQQGDTKAYVMLS